MKSKEFFLPPPAYFVLFTIPCQDSANLGECVSGLYNLSLMAVGIVAFVQIIYAGWLYLSAAGNTSKTGEAMSKISNAILGIVLLFSSYLILNTINPDLVGGGFGLPNLKGDKIENVDYDSSNTSSTTTTTQVPSATLTITTSSLPEGKVNQNYPQTLKASGGQTPYSWSVPVPSSPLPDGLNLNKDGTISGKPTTEGTYNFIVQAEDSSSPKLSATKALSVIVTATTSSSNCANVVTTNLGGAFINPIPRSGGRFVMGGANSGFCTQMTVYLTGIGYFPVKYDSATKEFYIDINVEIPAEVTYDTAIISWGSYPSDFYYFSVSN